MCASALFALLLQGYSVQIKKNTLKKFFELLSATLFALSCAMMLGLATHFFIFK
jgi:hypothetical protein